MEKTFNTIDKMLFTLMGIDLFSPHRNKTRIVDHVKIFLSFIIQLSHLSLQTYYLIVNIDKNSLEKLLLCCTLPGCLAIFIQLLQLRFNKENFCEFIDWVRSRYDERQPKLVGDLAQEHFEECPKKMARLSNIFIALFASSLVLVAIVPNLMENGIYVIAIVVPFTDLVSTEGKYINLCYQILILIFIYGIMYVFIMLFTIFTEHILAELKVIHGLAARIGEYESFSQRNKGEIIQVRDSSQVTPSSHLLGEYYYLHLGVLSAIEQTTKLYSFNTMLWEFLMIISIFLAFTFYIIEPSTLVTEMASVVTLTFQYSLVSKVSSDIEVAYKEIAEALYSSKWYLLPVKDQKVVLSIMMVAQRPKMIKVGIFGECNLERLADAFRFAYRGCLMINFLLNK